MKKYLSFQLIALIVLCNISYIYSMESEFTQNKICYLVKLPAEIWNHIAQFLLWETEAEFIARTEKEKDEQFPKDYYRYFGCENGLGIEHVIGTFSPDKNKIALFEKNHEGCLSPSVCTMCRAPTLVIVNLKEKEEDKVLFVGTLDTRFYRTIGLSTSGNMYAVIKKERKSEEIIMSSHRDYQDVLVIYDRIKKKECIFEIPDSFYVSHVMFNKQGTCVIAHARDFSSESMKKNYLLFDLKNDLDKEKNEKNQLLDYFRRNCVCQEIKEIEK